MHNFEFIRATSVAEAAEILRDDPEAGLLSGGQTLLPTMKQRLAAPSKLVSLTAIEALKGLSQEGDSLTIGGATTHAEVAERAVGIFPGLASLAGRIGDPAVRNRGTIGGSLANNDPAACYPAAALACGAMMVTDRREIPADDYFLGVFETALQDGEILTAVRFPIPEAACYQKFIQPASRFSMVAVFVARFADRVGVAVTGASEDGVFRWAEGEAALGAAFTPDAVQGLSLPETGMITDSFGTGAFRAHLIPVLTARAVTSLTAG
ncbi:MAG: carbon monoxide dehydrogenase [Rhodobacteraceae bacterium]|nr:carbon monoxide dehydrogenase [Paracoccaceae bacterium]MBR9821042.1 carbon monoxide dehydrogenase [Paracoccaceae bacterium]